MLKMSREDEIWAKLDAMAEGFKAEENREEAKEKFLKIGPTIIGELVELAENIQGLVILYQSLDLLVLMRNHDYEKYEPIIKQICTHPLVLSDRELRDRCFDVLDTRKLWQRIDPIAADVRAKISEAVNKQAILKGILSEKYQEIL
jgi:hypothetical protein